MNAHQAVKEILAEYEAGKHKPCTVQHTTECDERQAQYEQDIALYVAKWPNYCQKCGGAGYIYYEYDPSPAGVSLSPGTMTDADPCECCLERGTCPRCGTRDVWTDDDFEFSEYVICPECGWNEEKPDIAPEQPECWCWEQDAIEAERQIYEMSCIDDVSF
jgi:hypothetical protein